MGSGRLYRGDYTPKGNQQPRAQNPTNRCERHIVRMARAQGREANGEVRRRAGGAKKPKKSLQNFSGDPANVKFLGGGNKRRTRAVIITLSTD